MSKYTKATREATTSEAKWMADHERFHRRYQANRPSNRAAHYVASDYIVLSGNAKAMLAELLVIRRSRAKIARHNKLAKRTKKIARRM
jgi:hypothetical protein